MLSTTINLLINVAAKYKNIINVSAKERMHVGEEKIDTSTG